MSEAHVPFQAPCKDVQSNSNCESLESLCGYIWGIFHSLFVESQLSAPPAKIGILSIIGAISSQTLPKRLKLDKPTFVRHQHQAGTDSFFASGQDLQHHIPNLTWRNLVESDLEPSAMRKSVKASNS